jgi:hypothetical protein
MTNRDFHRRELPSEHELDVRWAESMDLSGAAGSFLRAHGPSIDHALLDFNAALLFMFRTLEIPELIGVASIANHFSMRAVASFIGYRTHTYVTVEQIEAEVQECVDLKLPNFADATWGQVVAAVALKRRSDNGSP